MEEKQQLEEQMRAVMDKYKYKRRQIRELQEDLHVSCWQAAAVAQEWHVSYLGTVSPGSTKHCQKIVHISSFTPHVTEV